jgi:tetratricopeptide (TPR) repeat protein
MPRRVSKKFGICILLLTTLATPQAAKSHANAASMARQGLSLSEKGRCAEALPLLTQAGPRVSDLDMQRTAGLAALRCALTMDKRIEALAVLQWLHRSFPRDPDVLYVSTHALSDLSSRESMDLAVTAPNSYQAHELNAEAFEVQGKWAEATKEYEGILKENPRLPGIHFRLGQISLSKPDPDPDMAQQAKKEFEEELRINPKNAGAEYVLGELARQSQQWDDAIQHFSRACALDEGFGDAYLGLGTSLIATKKFSEAIHPLELAVKLEPRNPTGHFNLATAYSRSGRKSDADREFALHRQLTENQQSRQDTQP